MRHTGLRYNSPLRYPGGKARLAGFVKRLFRHNGLGDGHYAEPYAGGAGLALALLYGEYARHIHINDIDRSIYAFWYAALHETDALCEMIRTVPVTPDEWRRQRAIQDQRDGDEVSMLALGFSTFFLNRTNRSGIVESGGMIGGTGQNGKWRLDARYNPPELAARVAKIGRYRSRIHLTRLDAIDFLAHAAAELPEKSLTYLDPPYFVKGQRRLYTNYYLPEDHRTVADVLGSYPHRWLVSYDAVLEIISVYRGYRRRVYKLDYSAAHKYEGTEVVFFSDDLVVPSGRKLVGS